jgi:4-hydroxybenzoate polyprenyltransferase
MAADPGHLPDPQLMALFGAGAFAMRGAGCTINDMWDADYDRRVARTANRPLASGELTHGKALVFLAAQLSAGLGVLLSLPHTEYCLQLGAASLPLVAIYPLMKRYTNYPQFVLGLTINWGALMGFAAVQGNLDSKAVLPLYFGCVSWTMIYDTMYAHQDKLDDEKLGIKSTALAFGEDPQPILFMFAFLTHTCWMTAGALILKYEHPIFFLGMIGAFGHLVWQIGSADFDDPKDLAYRFRSNNTVGALVLASFVVGNVMLE